MEGKIFNDSANIYQDQAKVLYEYYKSAAEKIVNEEKILEDKIKDAEYQKSKYNEDLEKTKTARTIAWIFCWTLVGLVIALIKNSKVKEFEALITGKDKEIDAFKQAHKDIFRDYRVTKMGVAYVPVAKRVAYNDKSFIVDQSGVTGNEKFTLQVIKQNELINEAVTDLQNLSKSAPIVESSNEPEAVNTGDLSRSIQKINFNDYFGKLDRTLRTISFSLGNIEEYNVELPVVFPDTEYAKFLKEHAATNVDGSPVFNIFDTSQYDGDIQRFNELNETRKALSNQSEQVDKVLKNLMVNMADAVQSTAAKKVASAGTLIDYSNRILFNILKAPYNFYSPVLEAEEIERIKNEKFDYESVDYSYKPFNLRDSSRVKLDLRSMSWVADDGSRTTVPFGVNQIQYEIIAPIVSNLLKGTRKERIEIYNHIKDQKLSYLNKWHQDTEDFYGRNRAEAADIINLMRSTLAEYSAAYNTLAAYKKTEATMNASQTLESAVTETTDNSAEVLAGYQAQAQQIAQTQQEFSDYMDRLHEDIDARAEKFGYVEYYDASLRDKKARDTAVAAHNVNTLDDRRKPLAEVSPLLAQTSDLPPEPSIDQTAYEYAGINLNAAAKDALDELKEVENMQISHADAYKSGNKQDKEAENDDFVTVDAVRSIILEAKELDPENEYGTDDLLAMLEKIQNHIKSASGEEEVANAFEQLKELKKAAENIIGSSESPADEEDDNGYDADYDEDLEDDEGDEGDEDDEDNEDLEEEEDDDEDDDEDLEEDLEDEDLDIDEVENAIEALLEKDIDGTYGVQDLAGELMKIKTALQNVESQTEEMDLQRQLRDIYNAAIQINDQLANTENQ